MKQDIEIAQDNLDRMLNWIGRFDNKASIILGLNLGMLSLLVTRAPIFSKWNWWMVGSSSLSLIALGLSFFCIYVSNYPRTEGPIQSFFYFGTIADYDIDDFCSQFSLRNETDHKTDLLKQTHRNAEILKKKFEYLKGAYTCLILGSIPWGISLLLFNNTV